MGMIWGVCDNANVFFCILKIFSKSWFDEKLVIIGQYRVDGSELMINICRVMRVLGGSACLALFMQKMDFYIFEMQDYLALLFRGFLNKML